MAQIPIWVKPGSRTDSIHWDLWRRCWVVNCRDPPLHGRANRAVAILVADWLELPYPAVRWTKAGTAHAKVLSATGITDIEVERRLSQHAAREGQPLPPGAAVCVGRR